MLYAYVFSHVLHLCAFSLWFDLLPPTSPLFSPLCVSVWKVQWSHLAASPVVSCSHSFSEPIVPSFAHLHLCSQEQHHHPAPSSPARTDPQSNPQPKALPLDQAPTDDTPPRVR